MSWLIQRAPVWRSLGAALPRLRRGKLPVEEAERALEGYRSLARDLASARQALPGSTATLALESIYASYHALVTRAPTSFRAATLKLLREDVPAVMRELRPALLWVSLLFVLASAAGATLVALYPELIALVASAQAIDQVEHGQLWTADLLSITPPAILSLRIFSNNIVVAVFAFAAGAFYGLGTFYLIAMNGVMLGAMFAFTHQHGLDGELLSFVLAHGPVELSVICIAGAAGASIGESLVRPELPTRRDSFQQACARAGKLLLPLALLLVGCGFIEGYLSPRAGLPFALRLAVGLGYFLFMLLFLSGRLWARPR
jgi:uncharacterized membrane protein SpoIIM required for sporulation